MANCEDLATKAELQELRDQLNAIIGENENGGTQQIFQAGAPIAGAVAQMAGTAYVGTKLRSFEAVKELVLDNPIYEPIYKDLAKGNAKWSVVKNSGAKIPLPDLTAIGKTAGQGAVTGTAASTVVASNGASLSLLANLVTIGATLALNIATVKVLDNRIDAEAKGTQSALDSMNNGMLRLYEKNQGDINAAQAEITDTQAKVQANEQAIQATKLEIQQARTVSDQIANSLNEARTLITTLQAQTNQASGDIQQLELDLENTSAQLNSSIEQVTTQLAKATEIIDKQQADIEKNNEQIDLINQKIVDIEDRVTVVEAEVELLRTEFEALKLDLQDDPELVEARAKLASALLIISQQKEIKQSSGGGSLAAAKGAADAQTATLELTSKLANSDLTTPGITSTDIYNNTGTFQGIFNDLLTQLQPGGAMEQQQLDDLRTGLKTDFKGELELAIGTLLIPDLVTLKDSTSERKIADATKTGICESLNGGSCPATPGNPNPTQGLKGLKDALAAKADQISAALGLANLGANQTILGIVKNTNDVINHAEHGLARIQSYAERAWKATRADKVMAGVSMALTVHNAMMLSNNLLSTVSEATNMTLNALGIRDEEDKEINLGASVKALIDRVLAGLIGDAKYEEITARIAKANRIYQAGINLLDTTYSLFDSARTVAELTAENTGKIGNALRESGAVYEDAYEEFLEKVNPQNASQRKLEKFREGLESVENVFDTVSQISSSVVETKENINQIKEEKNNLVGEINTQIEVQKTEKDTAKTQSQVTTEVSENDFDRATEEN